MKRRLFASLGAVLVGIAAVVGLPAVAQTKVVWKASDVHPLGYPTVEAIVRMGKKLETQTNGRISIQMYPSMQLGGEKEMIEQAQVGALQIARISVGAMGPVVRRPQRLQPAVHLPRRSAHAQGDRRPDRRRAARQDQRQPGTRASIALGWMDAGTRNVYGKKPVPTPADLKGHEDPDDGQPDLRRDDERDGRQRRGDGLQRALSARSQTGVVDGAENNPADAAGAEPLPRQQGLQP